MPVDVVNAGVTPFGLAELTMKEAGELLAGRVVVDKRTVVEEPGAGAGDVLVDEPARYVGGVARAGKRGART